MKKYINEFKEIYLLIKRYYADKKYEFAKKEFISCLRFIYSEDDYCTNLNMLGITDIWVDFSKRSDKFIFTIKLKRPGILIGKAGRDIDRLKKEVNDRFVTPCEIIIIEEKMF